jgi:hypothetical protein
MPAQGRILRLVSAELRRATLKFDAFNSAHEGYAVLLEEVDELWTEIKRNDHARTMQEAVQVAAMALRFLQDVSNDASIDYLEGVQAQRERLFPSAPGDVAGPVPAGEQGDY